MNAPLPRRGRVGKYAAIATVVLVVVSLLAVIGFFVESDLAVRQWGSTGGTIDENGFNPLPRRVDLGHAVGIAESDNVEKVVAAARRIGRLPGCDELALGYLSYGRQDVLRIARAFSPEILSISNCDFSDQELQELCLIDNLNHVYVSDIQISFDGLDRFLSHCDASVTVSDVVLSDEDESRLSRKFGDRIEFWDPRKAAQDAALRITADRPW